MWAAARWRCCLRLKYELVPIEPAAMEDRQVIEWDKDDIDALGFMKVDVLGLGTLSCLRRGFEFLEATRGSRSTLPPSLPKTRRPTP